MICGVGLFEKIDIRGLINATQPKVIGLSGSVYGKDNNPI
jgi:hypothetical protein